MTNQSQISTLLKSKKDLAHTISVDINNDPRPKGKRICQTIPIGDDDAHPVATVVDLSKFPATTIIDINLCVAIITDLPESSYFTINSMRAGIVDDIQDIICLDDKLYNEYAHLFTKFLGFSCEKIDMYVEKGWICLRNLN